MNISPVNSISCISSGSGIDEEYKKIIEKLIALGITPSGNKAADKAKLHEYELRQLKIELGTNGKGTVNKANYLTISSSEIEQLKENLQAAEQENKPKSREMEERTGAKQEALLNKYFIEKRKRIVT